MSPKRIRPKIEDLCEAPPLRNRTPFSVTHPEVACYWHPRKNRGFGPEDFSHGSTIRVWWYCDRSSDHVYQTEIKARVRGSNASTNGCPFCAGVYPSRTNWLHSYKIAAEFHRTKNGKLTPKTVIAASPKLRWWNCFECGNVYKNSPCARTRQGQGCPRCNSGERLDLRKYPEALKMFDRARNRKVDPTSMDSAGPRGKVWWQCPVAADHRYKAGFYKANRATPECPFCRGRKSSSTNNLTLEPRLAQEFHPTRNGSLKAKDLTLGSHRRIWWKCKNGPDHEWEQYVYMRKRGLNCPFCSNFSLSKTNVLAAYPNVAQEFHPTKNGYLTPLTLLATWQKRVIWRCSKCKNEWSMRPYNRTVDGQGCPECYKVNTGRGRFSARQKARAAKMLKKGLSVAQIAKEIGAHIMTIYRLRDDIAVGATFK